MRSAPLKLFCITAICLLLLSNCLLTDAKRIYSGSGRRSSSSSSSYSARRPSSHGTSQTVSRPTYQHSDASKLSYGGGYHSSAPAKTQTQHRPAVTASPIGWNVPKAQGPPPAYSATNTVGGARTNIHEAPPAYRATAPVASAPHTSSVYKANAPPPNYSAATNIQGSRSGYTPAQTYNPSAPGRNAAATSSSSFTRPRTNSTFGGGFGSGSYTPIQRTNVQGVQSSYPKQSLPVGATYYNSPSHLPAGATYHPSGSYHPPAGIPAGASYYPSSHALPAGASYHPAGHVPAGATYYPSAGGIPHGGGYYPGPAAVPAGATFLPAGASLPVGATYYPQAPVKSSSGLGFGSGLATGALGGALLGYALTPSHTKVVEHVGGGGYGGGGYGGGGGGYGGAPANNNGDDRIIIINNGPPGSVTTTDVGSGTTVINTNQGTPVESAYAPQNQAPQTNLAGQPTVANAAQAQLAPFSGPVAENGGSAAVPSAAAGGVGSAVTAAVAAPKLNAQPPLNAAAPAAAVDGTLPAANLASSGIAAAPDQSPAAGGIICVPVRVPEPDPADSTKTIEVEKIACYPAPPSPPPSRATTDVTSASPIPTTSIANGSGLTSTSTNILTDIPTTGITATVASAPITNTEIGLQLASFDTLKPIEIPEGSVALASLTPGKQPDIMKLPGHYYARRSVSNLELAESSSLVYANSANSFVHFSISTLLTMLIAYCML